jgi:hypothetical protein
MATEERNMRFKNKSNFQRLIRRYDGEGGGGAAPAADPTPVNPAPAEPAPANPAEPAQPFKAFTSQADYDRAIQQAIASHEEKLKAKLTPTIRAQLEKEANMTAEQKVQAQIDQLEADKKSLATEKNRIKAESLFVAKNIGEAERATLLDFCVSDDADASVKNAQTVIDVIDKAVKEQIKVAMKDVKAPSSTETPAKSTESMGKILGDKYAKSLEASKNAMDVYRVGGRRK